MPFLAGHIYPLLDPRHYDDDFGVGFGHIMIPHEATPGDCYIHDAWIVNTEGEVHPGYDGSPVPIRADDVEIENGRPLDITLPEPKSIFSAFGR